MGKLAITSYQQEPTMSIDNYLRRQIMQVLNSLNDMADNFADTPNYKMMILFP